MATDSWWPACSDADVLLPEQIAEPLELRRSVGGGPWRRLDLQRAADLVAGDRDGLDLAVLHLDEEVAEAHLLVSALKPVEKFQISTPTTTRTIQNSRLLSVEFNPRLLTALLSRVSRLPRAQ